MGNMSEKTFREAAEAAYKSRGLRQRDLADMVGVTPTSLNAILRGRTKLTEAMARRLADATGADFRLYWGGDTAGQIGEFVPIPLREARGSQGQDLAECGGHVAVDDRHAIAHNKVMIFDATAVATGSFNFTASAEERNAENVLILDAPESARLYREEWERHREHSAFW